ncbi:NADH-ubiquinone oxidoreductase chain 5 [Gastrolobium bilobum]|uniref:NADH-ubiquinone oxidoreductase chain 5 n=1 Tax=Gastrolobium bilobum TaxID=150636 RepID=UPI002AB1F467|nr:NADH-ubiquinone oxidoreductase chain 5 [Gastrolobium bilobum]
MEGRAYGYRESPEKRLKATALPPRKDSRHLFIRGRTAYETKAIEAPSPTFWANSPFVLPKNEILAESEFAAPTITKLIPILFSTSGASVAYNVNPVADQFQRAFQTSTFCNRLYSFFNKRWFFDQVLNDFLVRSFLRFGYEVSFEALDKGAIEILGPSGISYTFRRLVERISQLQSGFVYHYAFAMLLGSTLFVTFSRMWDSLSSWVDNRSSFIWIVSSFYNNKSSQ